MANEIIGTSGNDWLFGTDGADRIVGNGGDDLAVGKGGADIFVVDRDLYSNDSWRDRMVIADFVKGEDKVELKGKPEDYFFDGLCLHTADGEMIAVLEHAPNFDLYTDVIYVDDNGGGGPANRDPNANNDSRTTGLNTPVSINVLGNDSDPDGDALSVTSINGQSVNPGDSVDVGHGTATLLNNGQISFNPNAGFTGTETFSYHVNDGNGGEDTAFVSVTVEDNTPVDPGTAKIGNQVWLDANGDGIRQNSEAGVAGVDVTLTGAGVDGVFGTGDDIAKTTTTNSNGRYGFQDLNAGDYKVTFSDLPAGLGFTAQDVGSNEGRDSDANVNTGTTAVISLAAGEINNQVDAGLVELGGGNSDPNANNDSETTALNTPVSINVLGNDSDPESDPLSVTGTTNPLNGSVQIVNNQVVYTPNNGFTGTDVFTYDITDGNGGTDTAQVLVTVTPPANTAPDAVNDSGTTELNTPVTINVLGNDSDPESDPLSITGTSDPINGSVQIVNGQIEYTPNAGFVGNDVFTYDITDGNGGTDTAQVNVTVTPPANTAPDAVNDSETTDFNTPVAINVLGNDSDPEGDPLSVTSIDGQGVNPGDSIDVGNGTATLLNNGQISFNPDAGFSGIETFSYQVSDGNGGEDTANVTVDVTPQPKGTIVGSDSIREDSTQTYKVQLDQAVTEDTFITVRIKDGTAQQTDESSVFEYRIIDENGTYDTLLPEFDPSAYNSGFSVGDTVQIYFPDPVTRNNALNARSWFVGITDNPVNPQTPANGTGSYSSVNELVNDFRVFNPNGAIVTGDTFTVRVAAGSTMSESFNVRANQEVNLGKNFYGNFDTETTETFSLHVESIGGNDATGDLDIDILDKPANISPIAFDLNGDGVQTISINEGVTFDMLNTGTAINTGWLSGEDGFLAIDNNGDGLITSRAELFGGTVGEGFAKLETFDSNGDGLVNESDDLFADLRLWQDANENGVTDSGELVSLTTAGISDLVTSYTDVFSTDAAGNIHGEHSSAKKNGSTIDMVDVYFQVA